MIITESLITAFIIMLASLSGLIFLTKSIGLWISKHLGLLISFAAGVFFITAFFLVFESVEIGGLMTSLLAVIGGFILFLLGDQLIPESHHHHNQKDCEDCDRIPNNRQMLAGDAIHNIGDGIILFPAFMADFHIGIATAIGIFAHEFLQEVSEFFVLKKGGYSTKKALSYNFIVSSTILIGVWIGAFITRAEMIQSVILGIAAGGFLYIVFADLIPYDELSKVGTRHFWFHILAFVLGTSLILAVNMIFAHGH